MREDHGYDIETYPNIFTFTAKHCWTGNVWRYEISTRRNQLGELLQYLRWLAGCPGARMVGFNNEGFDYPVIHHIMQMGEAVTLESIYLKAMEIINSQDRFANIIWESDRFIEQVDLYKIHHFDNKAKSTSLKAVEFAMRSESIEDLPFEPGRILTFDEMDILLDYNGHDVDETVKFYHHSLPAIEFREELSQRYDRNFINFNDTKIGKEYLIMELEKATPGCCYDRSSGRRVARQTPRPFIRLADVILPSIRFDNADLNKVKTWLESQTITETKGVFKNLNATVGGFQFDFGLGGIHGSIDSAVVEANDTHSIIDLDVTSFYPSEAIEYEFHPEHLGKMFCTIYADLKTERVNHAKGSSVNAVLKLGLNGAFGDSNNPYSPFYDPQFTMAITINGQLLLCMLAERLLTIPGLRMIQANTDGVTVYCPRESDGLLNNICKVWQKETGLDLEEARYSRMFIRDVNNYLAETESGKIKRKGAYCHEIPVQNPNTQELPWHKDHGGRVIAKAAEAALLDGENIRDYIETHAQLQPLDFMLRAKVNRSTTLMWGDEAQRQRITRYYVSNTGKPLSTIMPPMKGKELVEFDVYQMPDGNELFARLKSEYTKVEKKGYTWLRKEFVPAKNRHTDINKGYLTTICNDMRKAGQFDFNIDWYVNEAEKLVLPLKRFVI